MVTATIKYFIINATFVITTAVRFITSIIKMTFLSPNFYHHYCFTFIINAKSQNLTFIVTILFTAFTLINIIKVATVITYHTITTVPNLIQFINLN